MYQKDSHPVLLDGTIQRFEFIVELSWKLINLLEETKCVLKFDVINIETISNEKLMQNIEKDGIEIYKRSEN